jgi:hypothetical protein
MFIDVSDSQTDIFPNMRAEFSRLYKALAWPNENGT